MRLYCGLASAGQRISVAVVDDAGRLLAGQEVDDTPTGYAAVCTLIAERSVDSGPVRAAMATDSETNLVPLLLAAAGEPLAVGDAGTVAQFMADPHEDTESHRRAVALARALQAGTLNAVSQPAPRDLAALRPVLIAHRAATAGRTASVGMLRDLLRELYPAALRAFPDPAAPLALAVLEQLPDPAQVAQAEQADLVAQLQHAGHADSAAAVTALKNAVAEMSTRRPPTEAVAETVRSGVATVRSSDNAAAALVKVICTQVEPRTGGRGFPAVKPPNGTAPVPSPATNSPVSGAPVSGTPVSAAPTSGSAAATSGTPAPPQYTGSPLPPPQTQPVAARAFGSTGAIPTQPSPATGANPVLPSANPPQEPAGSPVSGPPEYSAPTSGTGSSAQTGAQPTQSPQQAPTGAQPAQPRQGPTPPSMMPPAAPPPGTSTPSMMPPAAAPLPQRSTNNTYSGPPSGLAPQVSPQNMAPNAGQQSTSDGASSAPYGALSAPQGGASPLSAPHGSTVPDQSDEELSLLTPDELPASSRSEQPASGPPHSESGSSRSDSNSTRSESSSGRLGALIEFPRSARRNVREHHQPVRAYGEQERRDTENEPTQEYRPPSPRRQSPPEEPSSPPLSDNDGDLLIFAQTRSAWFTGEASEKSATDWRTEADAGWNAAEAASRPTVGGTTASGLPRRVPSANLVPGAAPNRERSHEHPINRDAAQLAAHTAGYFRGWNRARQDSQGSSSYPPARHQ